MMKQVMQDERFMLMPGFNYLILTGDDNYLIEVVHTSERADFVIDELLNMGYDTIRKVTVTL